LKGTCEAIINCLLDLRRVYLLLHPVSDRLAQVTSSLRVLPRRRAGILRRRRPRGGVATLLHHHARVRDCHHHKGSTIHLRVRDLFSVCRVRL
jgi:hypothetical protein